jgi:mono/diheme cytochrome c family protein
MKAPTTGRLALALAATLALLAGAVAWLNVRGEAPLSRAAAAAPADDATISRGAYLARAGNCLGCHTARGGADYAGGRGIATPFGTVYAPNLTPDPETGLGAWSAAEFWRALHHGRSRDGRLLYPAFPYPSFTHVTREDADALFAFLQRLPPVHRPNRTHELRFPYGLQASLAVWRALYFRPGGLEPRPDRPAAWNRGRYLVSGLGHCIACHGERNALGATPSGLELGGGLIPMQGWYAPSLAAAADAGGAAPSADELVALLKHGVSPRGTAMGPMAEVVSRSTQHLSDADLRAIAGFLATLPADTARAPAAEPADREMAALGARVYRDRCAGCHGERGEGAAGLYPPLAGNRTATLPSPNNVIQAIVHGGFAPSTAGNPRPFGMPPFGTSLSEVEIAAVATHVRQSWGHSASAVAAADVHRAR